MKANTPFVSGMGNIDDQHRNPNMNNKDHLVGQLVTSAQATILQLCNSVYSNRDVSGKRENLRDKSC